MSGRCVKRQFAVFASEIAFDGLMSPLQDRVTNGFDANGEEIFRTCEIVRQDGGCDAADPIEVGCVGEILEWNDCDAIDGSFRRSRLRARR